MVGDQLVHVSVAGDEQHVAAGGLAGAGERSQDVVALPALGVDDRHLDRLQELLDHGELLAEAVVHGRALRLVLRQHLHAHRRAALVEGDDHAVGIELVDHLEEHVEEAEDGVGGAASGALMVGGTAWKARCMSELPSMTAKTRRRLGGGCCI